MLATDLPRHIVIVMDGNGRWAKKRLLPRKAGHKAGAKTVRAVIEAAASQHIEALTLFAFGHENWQRPADEVNALMTLLFESLVNELTTLETHGIRLRVIGDRSRLSDKLRAQMAIVEERTQTHQGLQLNIAVSYSGRWDICQATRAIATAVQAGAFAIEDIDEATISQYVCLSTLPEPDLFIRTSGEKRLSNFLLWQLAYTELYFTDVYWPDFTPDCFQQALHYYAQRERRFGKISEQVKKLC